MNFFINYLHFLKGFLNDLKMPFDLLITFFHSGRNYFSNSKDFYNVLQLTEGQQIKQNFKDFLANQKIREDLLVIPVPQQITFAAGINFSLNKKSSHAAIFLSKGLNQLDPSAFSFIFKHEISHIKNCDVYVQKVLVLITTLASSPLFFYGFSCQSWIIAIIQAFFVMLMPMQIFIGNPYMEFREKKADEFAIKYSTKEEIQGMIRYLTAFCKLHGDVFNPPLTSRIMQLKKILQKTHQVSYEPSDQELKLHLDLLQKNEELAKKLLHQGASILD